MDDELGGSLSPANYRYGGDIYRPETGCEIDGSPIPCNLLSLHLRNHYSTVNIQTRYQGYEGIGPSPFLLRTTLSEKRQDNSGVRVCEENDPSCGGSFEYGDPNTFTNVTEQFRLLLGLMDSRGGSPIIRHPNRADINLNPRNNCEQYLANLFGDSGAYFADGYGVDATIGTDRKKHGGGHLYGSQTDPSIVPNVYVPEGGELLVTAFSKDRNLNRGNFRRITQGNPYVAYGPRDSTTASFVYYANGLGNVTDPVTLVVYHLTDARTKPLAEAGRSLLGKAGGFEEGGLWSTRGADGKFINNNSTHIHIELWSGKHNAFLTPADKADKLLDIRSLCPR